MAKVQSRRCVSLNRGVYEDLKRYCKAADMPMSAFIEDLIRAAMARPGESAPAKVLTFSPRPRGASNPGEDKRSKRMRYASGVHQF